jgi:hypothetical protein
MSHHVAKTKAFYVKGTNGIGLGAKVFEAIAAAKVNLVSVCAWEEGPDAGFLVDAGANNAAAAKALKKAGFTPVAMPGLTITLPNKTGALAAATRKLADAGINVKMAYASPGGKTATVVLSTADDKKAFKILEM